MEKNALLNAVSHGGKADVGAVVGKSMGESPDLRSMAEEVAKAAAEVVNADQLALARGAAEAPRGEVP